MDRPAFTVAKPRIYYEKTWALLLRCLRNPALGLPFSALA